MTEREPVIGFFYPFPFVDLHVLRNAAVYFDELFLMFPKNANVSSPQLGQLCEDARPLLEAGVLTRRGVLVEDPGIGNWGSPDGQPVFREGTWAPLAWDVYCDEPDDDRAAALARTEHRLFRQMLEREALPLTEWRGAQAELSRRFRELITSRRLDFARREIEETCRTKLAIEPAFTLRLPAFLLQSGAGVLQVRKHLAETLEPLRHEFIELIAELETVDFQKPEEIMGDALAPVLARIAEVEQAAQTLCETLGPKVLERVVPGGWQLDATALVGMPFHLLVQLNALRNVEAEFELLIRKRRQSAALNGLTFQVSLDAAVHPSRTRGATASRV